MQNRLGITAGLLTTFKYQITGRLEGYVIIKVSGHGAIPGVIGILRVHHRGHFLKRRQRQFLIADTVV